MATLLALASVVCLSLALRGCDDREPTTWEAEVEMCHDEWNRSGTIDQFRATLEGIASVMSVDLEDKGARRNFWRHLSLSWYGPTLCIP